MKEILCVIDMQDGFSNCYTDVTVNRIVKAIQDAKRNKSWVFVVEFRCNGRTDNAIQNVLNGYKYQRTIIKTECDGGPEIAVTLQKINIKKAKILFCGVNTDECVMDTVNTFSFMDEKSNNYDIRVIKKGCNSTHHFGRSNLVWKKFHKKVKFTR